MPCRQRISSKVLLGDVVTFGDVSFTIVTPVVESVFAKTLMPAESSSRVLHRSAALARGLRSALPSPRRRRASPAESDDQTRDSEDAARSPIETPGARDVQAPTRKPRDDDSPLAAVAEYDDAMSPMNAEESPEKFEQGYAAAKSTPAAHVTKAERAPRKACNTPSVASDDNATSASSAEASENVDQGHAAAESTPAAGVTKAPRANRMARNTPSVTNDDDATSASNAEVPEKFEQGHAAAESTPAARVTKAPRTTRKACNTPSVANDDDATRASNAEAPEKVEQGHAAAESTPAARVTKAPRTTRKACNTPSVTNDDDATSASNAEVPEKFEQGHAAAESTPAARVTKAPRTTRKACNTPSVANDDDATRASNAEAPEKVEQGHAAAKSTPAARVTKAPRTTRKACNRPSVAIDDDETSASNAEAPEKVEQGHAAAKSTPAARVSKAPRTTRKACNTPSVANEYEAAVKAEAAEKGRAKAKIKAECQQSERRTTRQSKRKRETVVVVTGIQMASKARRKALAAFGAKEATRMRDTTHVVVNESIKRTPKFLAAVSVASHVVTASWLEASEAARSPVDPAPYAVRDREAEARWDFSLRDTLAATTRALEGYAVALAPGARNFAKLPSDQELAEIVDCAGGVFFPTLPDVPPGPAWPNGLLAVVTPELVVQKSPTPAIRTKPTGHPSSALHEDPRVALRTLPPNTLLGIILPEDLFCAILRRRLDTDTEVLPFFPTETTPDS